MWNYLESTSCSPDPSHIRPEVTKPRDQEQWTTFDSVKENIHSQEGRNHYSTFKWEALQTQGLITIVGRTWWPKASSLLSIGASKVITVAKKDMPEALAPARGCKSNRTEVQPIPLIYQGVPIMKPTSTLCPVSSRHTGRTAYNWQAKGRWSHEVCRQFQLCFTSRSSPQAQAR
jgi:hypothetical protein